MKALIHLLHTLVAWAAGLPTPGYAGFTTDANQTSVKFRMNAGIAGDVNRTHPFSAEPVKNDTVAPMNAYGQVGVINAAGDGVRRIGVADQADVVTLMAWGISIRPFPTSPGGNVTSLGTQGFGAGSPASGQVMDVLRDGYIMATLNDPTEAPKKGDPVYVWCAASAGAQVQGGITATFSAGNTVKIANVVFNGPGDAAGNLELIIGDRRSL